MWIGLICLAAMVAVTAPAAFSAPAAGRSTLVSLETGVLQRLNAVRAGHDLRPLTSNPRLAAAATQHSREMAEDGYFEHDSANGTSFSTRIAHWYPVAGFRSWAVGENLLWSSPGVDPSEAVAMWMRSPGHRANILDPRWREIGIGAVHSASASGAFRGLPVTVVTSDFGVRR